MKIPQPGEKINQFWIMNCLFSESMTIALR